MKVYFLLCFFTIVVTCSADSGSLEYENGQNVAYNYNEYKNENVGRERNSNNHLLNSNNNNLLPNNYNLVPYNVGREGNVNNNYLRNLRAGISSEQFFYPPEDPSGPLNTAIDSYLSVTPAPQIADAPPNFETRWAYAPPPPPGYSGFGGGGGAGAGIGGGISGGIGLNAGIGGSIGAGAGAYGHGYGHGYGYGR